jgi:hypothetical protein
MNKPLFHNGSIVTDADASVFAEEYQLPEQVVKEVIAQVRLKGSPLFANYEEHLHSQIDDFALNLSFEVEPAQTDSVVDNAAFGLMNAMSGDDSFLITSDGICTINPNNPPELTRAYQVVSSVIKLRTLGDVIDDRSSWMLGSITSNLRALFGEDFDPSQVADLDTASYNTIWTAEKVYDTYKGKRYKLSFSHHKEALFQKIDESSKDLILSKAETYELGAKQVRDLSSIVKIMGDDEVIKNIRSKGQAEDLILAYKQNKVTYLVLNENEWVKIKGTASSIPTGRIVIDLKNDTVRKDNGEPIEIKTPKKAKSGKA